MSKDIDFSGFKSQNPLIEGNQVGTRKIDTKKILISTSEKNDVGIKNIPQMVDRSASESEENLILVDLMKKNFPETIKSDQDLEKIEKKISEKNRLESESMFSEIRKILG